MSSRGIRIGELDRRITFQEKVIQENEYNEDKTSDWQDIPVNPTVSASARPLVGAESLEADKVTYREITVFLIRYRNDLNVKLSLLFEGVRYNITSIIEPAGYRKTLLEIRAYLSQ
jgi:SPP1 family predicted phage head-tail adaptor